MWIQDQVPMVRHQYIGKNAHGKLLGCVGKQLLKMLVILGSIKYLPPGIAAINDVVYLFADIYAWGASYINTISYLKWYLTPFPDSISMEKL